MKAMGIDASATSTGIAIISPREIDPAARRDLVWSALPIQIKEFSGLERAVRQVARLNELVESTKPDLAVIEGYAYGIARAHTMEALVEVTTCLKLCLRQHGVPYLIVTPMQLKQFVAAKPVKKGTTGKARKLPVIRAVKRLWGFEHDCHDVVDAYVLAQMGLLALGTKADEWKSFQLSMRKKILSQKG